MKTLLLFLISFSAFSQDIKTCQNFRQEVLVKAVTEDLKDDKHPFKFVQNEKQATEFLKKYDVQKLLLSEKTPSKRNLTNCDKVETCDSSHDNVNFIRGLIYGLKTYSWSESTKTLAHEKISEFAKASTFEGALFLDLVIANALLIELKEQIPATKVDLAALKQQKADLDKTIKEFTAKSKNHTPDCKTLHLQRALEKRSAEPLRQKFSSLIQSSKL